MKIWYVVMRPIPSTNAVDPIEFAVDRIETKKPVGLPEDWKVAELIPLKDVKNMIRVIEDAADVFQEFINGKIKTDAAQVVVDGLRDLVTKE